MLNLLGSAAYFLAAGAALVAVWRDRAKPWRGDWAVMALAFVGLAAWRLTGAEALIHETVRAAAHAESVYDDRRMVQGPVLLLLALAAAWGGSRLLRRWQNYPRAIAIAGSATALLLAYSLIRAMSYHPVDALIYAGIGPLHINHIVDMGLTGTATLAAIAGWYSAATPAKERRRPHK